jgi:hypothetical protein
MSAPTKPSPVQAALRNFAINAVYGLMLMATLLWFVCGCYITVDVFPALANLRGGYDGVLLAAILTGFRDPTFFYALAMIPLGVLRLVIGVIR